MAELDASRGRVGGFFICASPESKLFAYELKKTEAWDLILTNHKTGTKAHYDALGQLSHVIESLPWGGRVELRTNYYMGRITNAIRTRRNTAAGDVTRYGPDLRIRRHFTSIADYEEFMNSSAGDAEIMDCLKQSHELAAQD